MVAPGSLDGYSAYVLPSIFHPESLEKVEASLSHGVPQIHHQRPSGVASSNTAGEHRGSARALSNASGGADGDRGDLQPAVINASAGGDVGAAASPTHSRRSRQPGAGLGLTLLPRRRKSKD